MSSTGAGAGPVLVAVDRTASALAALEAAVRRPCYLTGVIAAGAALMPDTGLHEEGLANAYALSRLRDSFLADRPMTTRRRHAKRVGSARALERFILSQPPAHASAAAILSGEVCFDDAQRELQEACHRLAGLQIQGRWVDVRDPEVLAQLE